MRSTDQIDIIGLIELLCALCVCVVCGVLLLLVVDGVGAVFVVCLFLLVTLPAQQHLHQTDNQHHVGSNPSHQFLKGTNISLNKLC